MTQIFRQAQRSGIVVNAHRINHGQPPHLTGFGDFYWFTCQPPEDSGLHPAEETAKLIVDIVARRIPAKFGPDPVRDIQVLTPTHRGPAGAGNLNALLQEALTPHRDQAPEKWYGGRVFRAGDKVTQLRNNYDKGKAGDLQRLRCQSWRDGDGVGRCGWLADRAAAAALQGPRPGGVGRCPSALLLLA